MTWPPQLLKMSFKLALENGLKIALEPQLSWVVWRISWLLVYCMCKTPKLQRRCTCPKYENAKAVYCLYNSLNREIPEHNLTCFCNYQEQNNNADWANGLQNLKYLWSWTNTKGWICIVWVTALNRIIKLCFICRIGL